MEAQGAVLFLTHMLACLSSCLLEMGDSDIICVSLIKEKFGGFFHPPSGWWLSAQGVLSVSTKLLVKVANQTTHWLLTGSMHLFNKTKSSTISTKSVLIQSKIEFSGGINFLGKWWSSRI